MSIRALIYPVAHVGTKRSLANFIFIAALGKLPGRSGTTRSVTKTVTHLFLR